MRKYKGRSLIAFPSDYTVVDIETTGLDPNIDEIIEIAAIRYRSGKQDASFQTLVKPSVKLNPAIVELTGITDDMLANAPEMSDVIENFMLFIGDDILVGHNVGFDINFLYEASVKHLGRPISNDHVNTLRFANKLLPDLPNRKLSTICEHFGLSTEGAHRALKDCELTNEIYQRMIAMIDNKKKFANQFHDTDDRSYTFVQPQAKPEKNTKSRNPYPSWVFVLLIVLSVIIIVMCLLIALIRPVFGIAGILFGILTIRYSIKKLKSK